MADYERGRDRERSESRRRADRHDDRGERGGDRNDRGSRGGDRSSGSITSLLVRNLSFNIRADEIRKVFSRHGDVRDVYIPTVNYQCLSAFCIFDFLLLIFLSPNLFFDNKILH